MPVQRCKLTLARSAGKKKDACSVECAVEDRGDVGGKREQLEEGGDPRFSGRLSGAVLQNERAHSRAVNVHKQACTSVADLLQLDADSCLKVSAADCTTALELLPFTTASCCSSARLQVAICTTPEPTLAYSLTPLNC